MRVEISSENLHTQTTDFVLTNSHPGDVAWKVENSQANKQNFWSKEMWVNPGSQICETLNPHSPFTLGVRTRSRVYPNIDPDQTENL